jgi:hypothetical protein
VPQILPGSIPWSANMIKHSTRSNICFPFREKSLLPCSAWNRRGRRCAPFPGSRNFRTFDERRNTARVYTADLPALHRTQPASMGATLSRSRVRVNNPSHVIRSEETVHDVAELLRCASDARAVSGQYAKSAMPDCADRCCEFSYPGTRWVTIMTANSDPRNCSAQIACGGILHDLQHHLALPDH